MEIELAFGDARTRRLRPDRTGGDPAERNDDAATGELVVARRVFVLVGDGDGR